MCIYRFYLELDKESTPIPLINTHTGAHCAETSGDGLLMPMSTSELDPDSSGFGQSGSGMSGSGMELIPEHIICSNPVQTLQVSLFDSIYSSLSTLECMLMSIPDLNTNSSNDREPALIFIIDLPNESDLFVTQHDLNEPFIDHFDTGTYTITITACSGVDFACDQMGLVELGNITFVIGTHQRRLFPYGETIGDESFRDVLDGAVEIPLSKTIPFWSSYYNKIYVSSTAKIKTTVTFLHTLNRSTSFVHIQSRKCSMLKYRYILII